MNLDMGLPNHQHLHTQLDTLRRFPRNALLPPLPDERLTALRNDLLASPSTVEPLPWLRQNRPDELTLHALQWGVNLILLQTQGVAQAVQAGSEIELPPETRTFLAGLDLSRPEFSEPIVETEAQNYASALEQRLRDLQPFPLLWEAVNPQDPGSTFIHQLFSLPLTVVPFPWIRANHLDTAALLAAQQIANQSLFAGHQSGGRVVRKIDISRVQLVGTETFALRFELDRLQLTEGGFRISGSTELEGDREQQPGTHLEFQLEGFDVAEDDRGGAYVVVSYRGSSDFSPSVRDWEFRYFPAVPSDVSAITLGQGRVRLMIEELDYLRPVDPRHKPPRTLVDEIDLSSLDFTIDL